MVAADDRLGGTVRAAQGVPDTSFDPVALAPIDDQHDGFWVLSRHEDVTAVATDPQRFTSTKGITIPPHGYPITLPLIGENPAILCPFDAVAPAR
jgi:cytochrome P450